MSEEKTRELFGRTYADVMQWRRELGKAQKGISDYSIEHARREFHESLMTYWEQIKRYRDEENIEREWFQEPALLIDGEPATLEDLSEHRFRWQHETTESHRRDSNVTETTRERVPWVMSSHQALSVLDQLDKCAHKIGLDWESKDIRKVYGAVEAAEDDPMSVEVPVDGDSTD